MEKGAWERQEPGRREEGLPSGPVLTPRLKVRVLKFPSLGLNPLGANFITALLLSSLLPKRE